MVEYRVLREVGHAVKKCHAVSRWGVAINTEIIGKPVLSNVVPPEIKRNQSYVRLFIKTDSYKNSIIYKQSEHTPETNSRKPPWKKAKKLYSVTISQCEKITKGVTEQYGIT